MNQIVVVSIYICFLNQGRTYTLQNLPQSSHSHPINITDFVNDKKSIRFNENDL